MDYTGVPVGDDEMEGTLVAPTILANRFIVSTSKIGFRIAFGESRAMHTPVHARINVFLDPFQAYELRNVLDKLLEPFLPEIEATKAAEEATEPNGNKKQ